MIKVKRTDAATDWREDHNRFGLRLATLVVSFQRFRRPGSGRVEEVPSSLGALPVAAVGRGHFLLPLADDEAFWIGLSARGGREFSLALNVDLGQRAALKDATRFAISIPPDNRIAGVPRRDGLYEVFSRRNENEKTGIVQLRITARMMSGNAKVTRTAKIEPVDYATFTKKTHRSAPGRLDPDAGYKGYRLP